jgi:hypothetical protein
LSNPEPFFLSGASGLVIAYAANPGTAIRATPEEILMMRPTVLMRGKALWLTEKGTLAFKSNTSSKQNRKRSILHRVTIV